jgi:hypothetical protein
MTVQLLSRAILWVAVVAALLIALTEPHIPGWLSTVAVVIAIPLGITASVRQKRMERDFVRRIWRGRQSST